MEYKCYSAKFLFAFYMHQPPGHHPAYVPLRHSETVSALVAMVPSALDRVLTPCLALLHRAARVSGMVETYPIIHWRHAAVPCSVSEGTRQMP